MLKGEGENRENAPAFARSYGEAWRERLKRDGGEEGMRDES
jgi:hypothetical protein